MEFMCTLLLLLFLLNTPSTWAKKGRKPRFKGIPCSQCQQWCEPVLPKGPQAVINMTLIEQTIDRKIKEAFETFPVRSCHGPKFESAFARNDSGGVFESYIPTIGFIDVFCDLADEGGNWTVFQRRMNGEVDFYRGWNDYVKGFGDLKREFWMGLEALHHMTKEGNIELKINMITRDDGTYWVAKYSNFQLGPSSDNYRLNISGFSGNVYDGLADSNNLEFTTKDADHDRYLPPQNCAIHREGAWWYDWCAASNLNGNFNKTDEKGFWWHHGSYNRLLRYSEMKFRRRF